MPKLVFRFVVGLVLVALSTAAPARADVVAVSDSVMIVDAGYPRYTYTDAVRPYVGGAFLLDNQGTGDDFVTFCLERNESVSVQTGTKAGGVYQVAAISGAATAGGFAGGNPDPLGLETQYLYFNYRKGMTAGWTAGWTTADLQRAFWHLENELDGVVLDGIAAGLIAHATANAPGFDFGNEQVRVLTLMNSAGGHAQDVLAITQVPEPATLLLLGAGLAGVVLRRKA
jgi:hypothetical protein